MRKLSHIFLNFVLAVTAVLFCSACDKEGVAAGGSSRVWMTFVADTPSTRSGISDAEGVVKSLDVLVFRASDGVLDASSRSEGTGSVSVSLSSGLVMHYYVFANMPAGALDSFLSEEALLSSLTRLTDLLSCGFIMRGAGTVRVGDDDLTIPVNLDRFACKVSVDGVKVLWLDSFSSKPEVTVGRVALVNVVGSTPLSGSPAVGDVWYNRMCVEPGLDAGVSELLVSEVGMPVTGSGQVSLSCPLYSLPNPTDNGVNSSNAPSWSPRNTRVALELIVDGESNWYPVDLPAMRCNRHYVITNLTILGPGSNSPDIPVSRSDVDFDISVRDWETISTPVAFDVE